MKSRGAPPPPPHPTPPQARCLFPTAFPGADAPFVSHALAWLPCFPASGGGASEDPTAHDPLSPPGLSDSEVFTFISLSAPGQVKDTPLPLCPSTSEPLGTLGAYQEIL